MFILVLDNKGPIGTLCGVVVALLMTGCSTIVNSGHSSGIRIESDPPGAEVFVDNLLVGITPATIDVSGPSRNLSVNVRKDGFDDASVKIEKSMDPWVWGNAPFAVFPIVAVIGFGVDAYGGKWYRYEPSTIKATLLPQAEKAVIPDVQLHSIKAEKQDSSIVATSSGDPDIGRIVAPIPNATHSEVPNGSNPVKVSNTMEQSVSVEESDSLLEEFLKGN